MDAVRALFNIGIEERRDSGKYATPFLVMAAVPTPDTRSSVDGGSAPPSSPTAVAVSEAEVVSASTINDSRAHDVLSRDQYSPERISGSTTDEPLEPVLPLACVDHKSGGNVSKRNDLPGNGSGDHENGGDAETDSDNPDEDCGGLDPWGEGVGESGWGGGTGSPTIEVLGAWCASVSAYDRLARPTPGSAAGRAAEAEKDWEDLEKRIARGRLDVELEEFRCVFGVERMEDISLPGQRRVKL